MEIKITTENARVPVTLMHIDGNLDSSSYGEFQKKAQELIKEGARNIVVDLAHSPFVSSAGLRAIHQIYKDLNAVHPDTNLNEEEIKKGISAGTYKSAHLKLANLSKETRLVFTSTGFDMFIENYDDTKSAIASF